MRGILAKAVPRVEVRREALPCQQPIDRDAGRQDGRLRVLGEEETIVRAFEAEMAERLAKGGVSFGKRVAHDGVVRGEGFAHADTLRPLAREDERDHVTTILRRPGAPDGPDSSRNSGRRYAAASARGTAGTVRGQP